MLQYLNGWKWVEDSGGISLENGLTNGGSTVSQGDVDTDQTGWFNCPRGLLFWCWSICQYQGKETNGRKIPESTCRTGQKWPWSWKTRSHYVASWRSLLPSQVKSRPSRASKSRPISCKMVARIWHSAALDLSIDVPKIQKHVGFTTWNMKRDVKLSNISHDRQVICSQMQPI